jgi:hypothetical protein
VRRAFEATRDGAFSLAAALHAGGIEEAFDIVTRGNQVPDRDASRLELMVYIRTLGRDWRTPERRVVEAMYEVDGVVDGRPRARRVYGWDEATDAFVSGEPRARIGVEGRGFERQLDQYRLALQRD